MEIDARNKRNIRNKRKIKVKLIFNPGSGDNNASPVQLMDIIRELQAHNFVSEAYLIEPECDLNKAVLDAISQGFKLIIACGGDGTVSAVARAIAGSDVILGIIPTGTQNNIALSLGIPESIPEAVEILRTGKRVKADMGIVTCGEKSMHFMEICSVGLFSALFSAGDDIQHGNIARIGDFLATLVTFPPSELKLILDDGQEIVNMGHIVLFTNMPYVARHYEVGTRDAFSDGLLDVLVFADISKLELIGYILQGAENSNLEDARIRHFRVRKAIIDTNPAMTVMADGEKLGEGTAQVEIRPKAVNVIVGYAASDELEKINEIKQDEIKKDVVKMGEKLEI